MIRPLQSLKRKVAEMLVKRRGPAHRVPRARRRWRVEIINENTLIRTWSMRLPELRAWIVGAALVAAMLSLVVLLALFTPLGQSLRGRLPGALRSHYVELTLRVDSLSHEASVQKHFTDNLMAVLASEPTTNASSRSAGGDRRETSDSLLPASEAEKMFVQQFEARERFNISVLSPIAAEGMIFEAPTLTSEGSGPVSAIYRGTVVGVAWGSDGRATVTVQHPNDFISVYGGMADTYVAKGAKVRAGERIGNATVEKPLQFELWRAGSMLDATRYVIYSDI